MTGLDTNILVRFIAQDDPVNSPKANSIMKALSVEDPGWISVVALAEFAWVMHRKFRISRPDLYTMLTMFLTWPEVVVEQADLVRQAVAMFQNGNADFADYLVACACRSAGCSRTLTFDRKAAKSDAMTLAS
jgi:predicted nucleic-acid-binding protein